MTLRGTEARIFLDGVDLSCVTANLGVEVTVGEYEKVTLCSTAMEYVPGMVTGGTVTLSGYFEGVMPGEEEAALYAAVGASNKTVAAIFDYSNLPAVAYCLHDAGNYNLVHNAPTDGLITIDGSFRSKIGPRRGLLGFYKTTISAVGTSAAVQIPGTLTTHSGKFFVFVHGIEGTAATPILFTVQSSANGTSGWASEAAFSFAAIGADVKDFTTPAGAYFSIATSDLGGADSYEVSVVFVVNGLTN